MKAKKLYPTHLELIKQRAELIKQGLGARPELKALALQRQDYSDRLLLRRFSARRRAAVVISCGTACCG